MLDGLICLVLSGHKPYPAASESAFGKRWGASKGLKRPKITYRKLTHRQAEKIVLNENIARDLFEKTFAGYRYLDMTPPKWSEYVTGVYAYARMRRIA